LGPVGALVTITGSNFGATQGGSTVTFNGAGAGLASNWSATSITVSVPSGASTGNVVVTVDGLASNGTPFTVTLPPSVVSVSPATGAAGVQVTVSGSGFGLARGTGAVWLGSTLGTVVSWSDTQVVATVALNSTSGTAQVRQSGVWSNAVPFNVNTATISNVTPASGVPGTQVTIAGSGFAAAQGSGQVWLGAANGVVQSWSDTQIVALVAAGSASGKAQVLQNGVWSNAVPFTVNTLRITSVDPSSGGPGTSVTITGGGFGSSQGNGTVWLGSTDGQVLSWSDTQVVATVGPAAVTGIARIRQNGVWSNAVPFTVPGGNAMKLTPNLLNLVVGETHAIRAISGAGQPVAGLTWTSSDPNVVGLSSDDPPLLTALAAGHVTITAGAASADVTVSSGPLPPGTVLWSNPGDPSIVPAVPSSSGVADVFAFQDDGTVRAITSDGVTAWTADVSQAWPAPVPDFQGGLVAVEWNNDNGSIVKFDGITGQPHPVYTPAATEYLGGALGVHPDGTIFAFKGGDTQPPQVIGIDPATGAQKFSVPLDVTPTDMRYVFGFLGDGLIIAGDGYAYVPYLYFDCSTDPDAFYVFSHLKLLRVNSDGVHDYVNIRDWASPIWDFASVRGINMITNADKGILLSWDSVEAGFKTVDMMALTTGASVSLINSPGIPGQWGNVIPVLQAQDGSFVGTVGDSNGTPYMIAFDATGNVRWTVPNYSPQIATADGGVIATSDDGSAIAFDQNGNATGQIPNLPTYSWTGNWYRYGSVNRIAGFWYYLGASFWTLAAGQYTIGTGGIPIDSISNKRVKEILTPAMWQKFANSHCSELFRAPGGIPSYDRSLQGVWKKQHETNFYDVGNPGIEDLTLRAVTGGEIKSNLTLTDYLSNFGANGATANMGSERRTAVVLGRDVLSPSNAHPEFTLVHELLLHAYAGQLDDFYFGNALFLSQGLWRPDGSTATTTLSTWMSTDCTCTPGKPGTTCQANTAQW
jgi:hypothetical protein